jgi:L-amino acid N-acyltransferase YncA
MSDGGIRVRRMEDADWPAFHEIFGEVVAGGDTIAYPDDLTAEEARVLWVERSSVAVVAVDDDGTVLGGAKCGPKREGRGRHVATASFMVSSAAQGRGVGRALGEWVLDWARSEGYAAMQFDSVVETNTAAVALWQHLGFSVLGTVPEVFDSRTHGRVGMHVMHRYL